MSKPVDWATLDKAYEINKDLKILVKKHKRKKRKMRKQKPTEIEHFYIAKEYLKPVPFQAHPKKIAPRDLARQEAQKQLDTIVNSPIIDLRIGSADARSPNNHRGDEIGLPSIVNRNRTRPMTTFDFNSKNRLSTS